LEDVIQIFLNRIRENNRQNSEVQAARQRMGWTGKESELIFVFLPRSVKMG